MRPFVPVVSNPHLLTILGNFWPRNLDFSAYPVQREFYRTEPDVQVLVETQTPAQPTGELVMVHGLEGAGDAGYIRTLAHRALQNGLVAHRFHMRTCGGTEHLCNTLYHGGLTGDLLAYLRILRAQRPENPIFLAGFSLGGNVALKLAGELGPDASELLAGVCAVSAPIDLSMAAKRIGEVQNRIYERRFLARMRARLFATGRYTRQQLERPRSLYGIDDRITAPSFGFGTAARYYATQSSNRFLSRIRIPALVIAAQDDPLVPFAMYREARPEANPMIQTIYPAHGGHLGFIARERPRFWADETITAWILERLASA